MLSYIPVLTMRTPGQFNQFSRHINNLCSFNFNFVGRESIQLFTFDWTLNPSKIASLQIIGIIDRCFINQVGFKFFAVIFVFIASVASVPMYFISRDFHHRFGLKIDHVTNYTFSFAYIFFLNLCV